MTETTTVLPAPRGGSEGLEVVKEDAAVQAATSGARSVAPLVEVEDLELSMKHKRQQGIALAMHDVATGVKANADQFGDVTILTVSFTTTHRCQWSEPSYTTPLYCL